LGLRRHQNCTQKSLRWSFFQYTLAEIKARPICVVEPAGTLVDLGDDGFDPERQEAIFWHALLRIEHFALPSKEETISDELVYVNPAARMTSLAFSPIM
jgi:hypothetical protein